MDAKTLENTVSKVLSTAYLTVAWQIRNFQVTKFLFLGPGPTSLFFPISAAISIDWCSRN